MPMLRLGAAGTASLMGEWWVFELCSAMAGTLGIVPLAAHASLQQLAFMGFATVDGVAEAATIRTGNRLGAGDPAGAKNAAVAVLCVLSGMLLVMVAIVAVLGGSITSIYTRNPEVMSMAASVVPFYLCFLVADGFSFVTSSILRGAAKNTAAAKIVLLSSYGITLPVAAFLALYMGLGLLGLWVGLACGITNAACWLLLHVWRLDWEGQSREAQANAAKAALDEHREEKSMYDREEKSRGKD